MCLLLKSEPSKSHSHGTSDLGSYVVVQEVSLGLNLPAILNLIWPGHPPFIYAHANTTTSDEHSIVTLLHSTRIIYSQPIRLNYSMYRPPAPNFEEVVDAKL